MLEVAVCQELWDETALSASMHFALQIPELEAIASLGISAHSSKRLQLEHQCQPSFLLITLEAYPHMTDYDTLDRP